MAKAPSRTLNPSLPQAVIDRAYATDPAVASAEYGAEFRTDVETFVSREVVEAVVVPGRHELPKMPGERYVAFVDPSGGSSDAMTLAIAHADKEGRAILDAVRERKPPFSPENVVSDFTETLKSYGIARVQGDRYAGEWAREPFRKAGIAYDVSEKVKTDIYRDSLPLLNSGKVELLDHPTIIAQLCGLERRTARGGRDSIDHAPGGHDDLVNSVCGAVLLAAGKCAPMVINPAEAARFSRPAVRRPLVSIPSFPGAYR